MRKRIVLIIVAMLIVTGLLFAGAQQEKIDSDDIVQLNYFYRVTSPEQEEHIKWLVSSFNEINKDKIQVLASGVDDETYKTKILIELRSDTPPDIFFYWEGGRTQSIVDAGYVLPLDSYYSQYDWENSLNSAGVSLAEINGMKFFVPYEMAAAVVWYRPSIFKKLNLTPPKTWEEMEIVVETLKKNGVAPFVLTNQKRWPAQFEWSVILVNKYGLDVYQDLINNKIAWTDERVIDTFATLQNMAADGWYLPGINALDLGDGVGPFGTGDAAMWYQGTWMPSVFKGSDDEAFFEYDFFTWPKMSSHDPVMEVFAENAIFIHKRSENPDAAAKFIDYFVSTDVQTRKTYDDRPFPANVNVDLTKLDAIEIKLAETMKNSGFFSFMHVDHAFEPAIANVFLDVTQAILAIDMTPEKAAAEIEKEAQRVRGLVK
jgi:raffinose/stachyose/melibiose transport system substrate-binding protein